MIKSIARFFTACATVLLCLMAIEVTTPVQAAPVASAGITTTLTLNTVGSGMINVNPTPPVYNYGQVVTLSAAPSTGWLFSSWNGDLTPPEDWWDAAWDYRVAVNVDANNYQRTDKPVEVELNFTTLLANAGASGALDLNSLRVVEINANAQIVNTAVPFQFDQDAAFNASSNARGKLIFFMTSSTSASGGRTFHIYFDVTGKGFNPAPVTPLVSVTSGVLDEGQSSYQVQTTNATYYYHEMGGGFSSIVDANGNDWVNYNSTPGDNGTYRGLPNVITNVDGTGIEGFRPGVTNTISSLVSQGPLKITIHSETIDGQWEALWEFYPTYARMTLLKVGGAYWFTYGGTPGGVLDTSGANRDRMYLPDSSANDITNTWVGADLPSEEWAYAANTSGGLFRSLFMAHHENDSIADSFRRQSGTAFFKFGRTSTGNPGITGLPAHFTIGLIDATAFSLAAPIVRSAYKDLVVTLGAVEREDAPPPPPPGSSTTFTTTMTSNRAIGATFTAIPYTLDTSTTGSGSITRNPNKTTYTHGEQVTLTAASAPGWSFNGWSGALTGSTNPAVLTMTGNATVSASFSPIPYTIEVTAVGTGTVTLNPTKSIYNYGDIVTLTATPGASGLAFVDWSGDLITTTNPINLFVDSSKVITATFADEQYSLIINVVGGGGVNKKPNRIQYTYGNVTLTAVPNFGWSFSQWSGDLTGATSPATLLMNTNRVVTATFTTQAPTTLTSDDFNSCTLNSSRWSFVNPLNDATMIGNGAQVELTLPGGVDHDIWVDGALAPRVMQTVNNVDFEIETKFDSTLNATYQMQGFLVEQDSDDRLRFNVQREGDDLQVKIIRFVQGSTPKVMATHVITDVVNPNYLRLYRRTNSWTFSYSDNGSTWRSNKSLQINHELVVGSVGVFVGNAAPEEGEAPSFTGLIDYIFNTAAPVAPEDPLAIGLPVSIVGGGSVDESPNCGSSPVQLTAQPFPGWSFTGWAGKIGGTTNPITVAFTSGDVITATFTQKQYNLTVSKSGSGSVAVDPIKSFYRHGDVITLTANSALGWEFNGWGGSLISSTNPLHIIMDGNKSIQAAFRLSVPSTVASDDFNHCALNEQRWDFINPLNDAGLVFNGEQVQISVPAGIEHNIWENGNQAPRLMQPANDVNFRLEAKFDSPLTARFQLQGMVVEEDANDLMRINFQGRGTNINLVAVALVSGQAPAIIVQQAISNTTPLYLQVVRTGDIWTLSHSTDGVVWRTSDALRFFHSLTVRSVGLFAGNVPFNTASAPAHTALVDYFFNGAAPISPEDGVPNLLPVFISGNGTVVRDPQCGNPVTLTAIPEDGWSFAGWGGSPSATSNPAIFRFNTGNAVTAVFTEDRYNVTTSVNGSGKITIAPQKSTYLYGEPITITASPDPGWFFINWGGNVAGSENPKRVVMNKDKLIKATFSRETYTLATQVTGNGTIERSTYKERYGVGEVVQLSAKPASGWNFVGWSGDLNGNISPATVSMTTNKNVMATFAQAVYTLQSSTTGNGQIQMTPSKPSYQSNDQVTLSAAPAVGWRFVRWEGDLNSTLTPITLVMNNNKLINAVFAPIDPNQTFTISKKVVGSGDINFTPAQAAYTFGVVITVTAVPANGWTFTFWSDELSGSVNPTTLVVDGNLIVTANFTEVADEQYLLHLTKTGEGSVSVDVTGPYNENQNVTLTASPAPGWEFVRWTGALTGSNNPATLTFTNKDLSVAVLFAEKSTTKLVYLPLVAR
jgi:hypothetical protein